MNADFTLALAFASGLFGAFHCLGMCAGLAGGFFASYPTPPRLPTQLLYHGSRILVYILLGIGSALLGRTLAQTGLTGKGQGLMMLAAVLLILGLGIHRLIAPSSHRSAFPGRMEVIFHPRPRRRPRPWLTILVGTANGLVPCSLVFSVAIKATAIADPLQAGLLMLAFGLGTLPTLVALSWGGAFIGSQVRGLANRLTAVLVILLGLWTLYEGYLFFDIMRGLANG